MLNNSSLRRDGETRENPIIPCAVLGLWRGYEICHPHGNRRSVSLVVIPRQDGLHGQGEIGCRGLGLRFELEGTYDSDNGDVAFLYNTPDGITECRGCLDKGIIYGSWGNAQCGGGFKLWKEEGYEDIVREVYNWRRDNDSGVDCDLFREARKRDRPLSAEEKGVIRELVEILNKTRPAEQRLDVGDTLRRGNAAAEIARAQGGQRGTAPFLLLQALFRARAARRAKAKRPPLGAKDARGQ